MTPMDTKALEAALAEHARWDSGSSSRAGRPVEWHVVREGDNGTYTCEAVCYDRHERDALLERKAMSAALNAAALSSVQEPVAVRELAEIEAMLNEGQGDDDGPQIMPNFKEGMSTLAKVEKCLHLLEKRRDVIVGFYNRSEKLREAAIDKLAHGVVDFICDDLLPSYDVGSAVGRNDVELFDTVRATVKSALSALATPPAPQGDAPAKALAELLEAIKSIKGSILHGLTRRETDVLMTALHNGNVALPASPAASKEGGE